MSKVILVLEDERPLLEVIKTKLEKNDFEVVTARSADQAMNYLKDKVQVDAVWLDHYLLGKESGLDFVAKMKHDGSAWRQIPIFVVSNTASSDKVQSYLRLGVKKYFTKVDYRLDQIVADIKAFLEKPGGGE